MTPTPIVIAAALVVWGSISAPAAGPMSDAVQAAPTPTTVDPAAPPPAPAPIVVKQLFDEPTLIARPSPPPPPTRAARPTRPALYRDWRFWTISGGLFAVSVVVTILVTRPGPQPYAGNLSPNVVVLP